MNLKLRIFARQMKKEISSRLETPRAKELKIESSWDDTNYVVRKKLRNEMANAVSSFLRRHEYSVISDKES